MNTNTHTNPPATDDIEICEICGSTDPATVGEREFSWGYAVSCDDPECLAEFTTPAPYEPYIEFLSDYGYNDSGCPRPQW